MDLSSIDAMSHVLLHRGPDDSGVYLDGSVGLAHRRLSIIDLSVSGHQPMGNEDGTLWVTYNGEIYNHLDLRRVLSDAGHCFASHSDTEVLIHGYEEWGDDLWNRLDGMFALALWDARRRELILARDPFSIKPLYYAQRGETVLFASELKSLLASGLVHRELNYAALSDFFTYFYTPGPATIVKDVSHVKPGHIARFRGKATEERRYYKIPTQPKCEMDEHEVCSVVRNECREAVRKTLVADVPVGVLLSGGIDSNIILEEMLDLGLRDVYTVTVGFDTASYDETSVVKERVRGLPVRSHFLRCEDAAEPAVLDDMIWHQDSLSANVANLAMYAIFKATASEMKVVLSGTGLDEMFAGYSTYIANRLRPYYRGLPSPLRRGIRALAHRLPQTSRKYSFDYLARKFTVGAELDKDRSHYWWRTILTDDDKKTLVSPDATPKGFARDSFAAYESWFRDAPQIDDDENRALYADLYMFCGENANMMFDNLSMAFSLEVRPPFLTKRFVESAFRIPYCHKLRGGTTKYCLRRAYENSLPRRLIRMKKSGLVSPLPGLLRGPLKEMIHDLFASAHRIHPFLNQAYLQQLLAQHIAGKRNHAIPLYTILVFLRWYQLFLTGPLTQRS